MMITTAQTRPVISALALAGAVGLVAVAALPPALPAAPVAQVTVTNLSDTLRKSAPVASRLLQLAYVYSHRTVASSDLTGRPGYRGPDES